MRSWNLSGIWRLPTSAGPLWLKAVPAFFAHEGSVIDWIGSPPAPRLVAHTTGRALREEVPGAPNHDTTGPALEPMVQLPGRLAQIDACGVPDTLVHADFHPGNVVGTPEAYVLLDWGDSFVGHPLIDEWRSPDAWTRRAESSPAVGSGTPGAGSPRRRTRSAPPNWLRPVLPLLAAVMYADFCAGIEPDERIYHESDGGRMLHQAVLESRTR